MVTVFSNDLHYANLTVLEIVNDIEQNPYVVPTWYFWMFTVFHSHFRQFFCFQSGTQSQTCHFILKAGRISAAHSDPFQGLYESVIGSSVCCL